MSEESRSKRSGSINPANSNAAQDPHYQEHCISALCASVESLIELAGKAGWAREYVVMGIILVAARQLGDQEALDRLSLLYGAEHPAGEKLQ